MAANSTFKSLPDINLALYCFVRMKQTSQIHNWLYFLIKFVIKRNAEIN